MNKPILERRKAGNLTLSKHACARMRENGLTYSDVELLWNGAVEEKRDDHQFGYDFLHHPVREFTTTKYYRSNNFRFIIDTKDRMNLKVITLIKLTQ
jgi:hypothetical protein